VHLLVRDGGDAAARADRAVVELDPEILLNRGRPLADERGDEGAPRAVDAGGAAPGRRRSGCGHREGRDERGRCHDESNANELAVSRHLDFPPPQGFAGKVWRAMGGVGYASVAGWKRSGDSPWRAAGGQVVRWLAMSIDAAL